MNAEEYQRTQEMLVLLAGMVVGLDLPAFLEKIDRAETLGPLVDPTLYHRAMDKLEQVKSLAQAANTFRAEARKQMIANEKGA